MQQYAQQRKSNLIANFFLCRKYVTFYIKSIFITTSSNTPAITAFHKYRYVSNVLIHIQILSVLPMHVLIKPV